MEENLKWLGLAFAVAWGLHIGYVALLAGRTRNLERQLRDLRAQVGKRD